MHIRIFLLLLLLTIPSMMQAQINRPGAERIPAEESVQRNLRHRVFYEIFIRSFYDSNQDGIGDLNGITLQLDYLAGLGITGIWITPFYPSPSYHKYDVLDYMAVDPQYGTMEDFKKLVDEAHKKNILVLIDFVANHTAYDHPWFRASLKNDPQFRNYYNWSPSPDPADKNWHLPKQGDQPAGKEKYYGFFSPVMPDLNMDHEAVRDTLIDIGTWWLKETAVDGFRLDAAQHIYDAEDTIANNAWWKQFTDSLKKVKPDVITIGEVWNKKEFVATYKASLSGAFNFELSWEILKMLQEQKDSQLIENLLATKALYAQHAKYYSDPIFLSNHDGNRIISDLGNNREKAKLAAAIYLSLPGTPFLYYGEELGMRGTKPDEYIREPFLWDKKGQDTGQTNWQSPKHNKGRATRPLAEQKQDDASVYTAYKKLISSRSTYHALSSAALRPVAANNESLLMYERGDEGRTILVIHNLSGSKIKYSLPRAYEAFRQIIYQSSPRFRITESMMELPPYGSILLGVK